MKAVIVNADDLGHSDAVNAGVVEAHERGVVTSASLMVLRPAAADGAAAAGAHPRLGLGLHLELDGVGEDRLQSEVDAQLEMFRALVGDEPTHVDSHHHVHLDEPARSVVLALGRRLGRPVRSFSTARYCGEFYGRAEDGAPRPHAISAAALCALLRRLPDGVTEVGCHPALGVVAGSSYSQEREREVETLCDPAVRATLEAEGILLRSFREHEA